MSFVLFCFDSDLLVWVSDFFVVEVELFDDCLLDIWFVLFECVVCYWVLFL